MTNKRLKYAVAIISGILFISFITGFDKSKTGLTKQPQKVPTIGVLQFVSHPSLDLIYKGFVEELEREGYKDKETIHIDFQNGQADQSKLSSMSQQLISKKSDALVGIATPAAQALANQTTDIPIILGAISDPKAAGLVKDNNHPGGNITGVSDQSPVEAQVKLMKELLPTLKTIGVIYSSAEDNSQSQVDRFKTVAQKEGLTVKTYAVPSTNEISQMTHVMTGEVDAIYTPTDNTIANGFQTIVSIADEANIPIFPSVDTMVEEGGIATIGINQYDLGVQTAKMVVDVITKKKSPSDTPIYTFQTGDLVINEEKAQKLGITIPKTIKEEAKK